MTPVTDSCREEPDQASCLMLHVYDRPPSRSGEDSPSSASRATGSATAILGRRSTMCEPSAIYFAGPPVSRARSAYARQHAAERGATGTHRNPWCSFLCVFRIASRRPRMSNQGKRRKNPNGHRYSEPRLPTQAAGLQQPVQTQLRVPVGRFPQLPHQCGVNAAGSNRGRATSGTCSCGGWPPESRPMTSCCAHQFRRHWSACCTS
jgi:hypothetical protein